MDTQYKTLNLVETADKTQVWVNRLFGNPCFFVQIKQDICKNNVNTTIRNYSFRNFHLSGHTFIFRWMVQDLEVFWFSQIGLWQG